MFPIHFRLRKPINQHEMQHFSSFSKKQVTMYDNVFMVTVRSSKIKQSLTISHARYIRYSNMTSNLKDKIAKFHFKFVFPSIPERDLDVKKTPPNRDVCPESPEAVLEY